MPSRLLRSQSSSMTLRADTGSSEATGSSAKITWACCTRARAMAARCCWPPESRSALWPACSARPTRCRAAMTVVFSCWLHRPMRPLRPGVRPSRPSAAFANRLSRPTRLNCWKTKPMRARTWRTRPERRPCSCTVSPKARMRPAPASMGCRPAAARIRVDLPEPEAPIRATMSPAASSRLTWSNARRAP